MFQKILKTYWGYDSFRPLQEDIIQSIHAGHDTLGLMPTGGGKSITFQVPALAMEGVCIVVTPLVALMKDQVDALKARKIKAAYIYSGMRRHEILRILENALYGGTKFLYVSPERLTSELFLAKFRHFNLSMIVIDEAHCISQWGYDFRPPYLEIARIRELHPAVPVLALTATATPAVVEDIQSHLSFRPDSRLFQKSFYRSNLTYLVRKTTSKEEELVYLLNRTLGSAIVYTRNRKRTKELADYLVRHNISADFFHAGLLHDEKDQKQNRWKQGELRVIVATNAFGMGIDKPDVRLVVHFDMPSSLEEYYQEAGRAGRDEQRAYAVVLYNSWDKGEMKRRVDNLFPTKELVGHVYECLASYYTIGVGYGFQAVHEFNLSEFCHTYKLPAVQTHSALQILSMSGYIEHIPEDDNQARLQVLLTREELYRLHQWDDQTDRLLNDVFRNYTGLFSDFVYLNENEIARRIGIDRPLIYEMFVRLAKAGIISYVPQKRTAYILYPQRREDTRHLNFPPAVYEERRTRFEERIDWVIRYLAQEKECRSRFLISYFSDPEPVDCLTCDLCRAKQTQKKTDNLPLDAHYLRIYSAANGESADLRALQLTLSIRPKEWQTILLQLAECEWIAIDGLTIHFKRQP